MRGTRAEHRGCVQQIVNCPQTWDSTSIEHYPDILFIPYIIITMADIPTFHNLSLERHGNVFVLTMQKPPENRLNSSYCQEMIRAYRVVEKLLGPDSEGAVITRGSDAKFWCTVCGNVFRNSDEFANTKASRDWN
jgi:hypothetical protein